MSINKIKSGFREEAKSINSYVWYMEKNYRNKAKSFIDNYKFDLNKLDIKYQRDNISTSQLHEIVLLLIKAKIEEWEHLQNLSSTEKRIPLSEFGVIGKEVIKMLKRDGARDEDLYMDNLDEQVLPDELNELEYDYLPVIRIFDINESTNIYRQSFILLVASFEAYFFDIFITSFASHFDLFLKLLHSEIKKSEIKQLKLFDIDDIARYDDIVKVRENIVRLYAKNKYLRELLYALESYDKDIFNVDGKSQYISIIEIIKRRNVHLHNKGVIDKDYLEFRDGKATFNPYRFHEDTYAVIDSSYFNQTFELLFKFIDNLNIN